MQDADVIREVLLLIIFFFGGFETETPARINSLALCLDVVIIKHRNLWRRPHMKPIMNDMQRELKNIMKNTDLTPLANHIFHQIVGTVF